jgi:hypothetical protein
VSEVALRFSDRSCSMQNSSVFRSRISVTPTTSVFTGENHQETRAGFNSARLAVRLRFFLLASTGSRTDSQDPTGAVSVGRAFSGRTWELLREVVEVRPAPIPTEAGQFAG